MGFYREWCGCSLSIGRSTRWLCSFQSNCGRAWANTRVCPRGGTHALETVFSHSTAIQFAHFARSYWLNWILIKKSLSLSTDVRSNKSREWDSFIWNPLWVCGLFVCGRSIYRYSPPFWAAIHKWYPHKTPNIMVEIPSMNTVHTQSFPESY